MADNSLAKNSLAGNPLLIETVKRPRVAAASAPAASAEKESQPRLHLDYIDGLRFALAFWVLLSHDWSKAWPAMYGLRPGGLVLKVTDWMEYAHLAVSVFIVVSGFCLMLPVVRAGGQLRGGAWTFLTRRALRILPPYYAAVGLTLLLIWRVFPAHSGSNFDGGLPVTAPVVGWHLLLLQDILAPYKISGVLWSISVEWRIYFLFPPLLALRRWLGRYGALAGELPLAVVALVALCGAVLILPALPTLSPLTAALISAIPMLTIPWLGFAPTYVALFIVGMLAATVATPNPRQSPTSAARATWARDHVPWGLAALALTALVVALAWAWGGNEASLSTNQWCALDVLAGSAGASLLIAGASHTRAGELIRRTLGWKPLATLGGAAYSIYLMHNTFQQVVYVFIARPLTSHGTLQFAILVASTPLVLGACWLFYLAFERPCVALLRRRPMRVTRALPGSGQAA